MLAQLEGARQLEHYLANHDAVTGLPNRQLFYHRLGQAITEAKRDERSMAVVFLDLDDFKSLNDSLGHDVGDQVLRAVAMRLGEVVTEPSSAARFGGDEFTFLFPRLSAEADATTHVQRILDAIAEPIPIEEHTIFVTGSAGISLFPADGGDLETMLRNADMAMYAAKQAGRNSYQLYVPDMNRKAMQRLEMERQLRHALAAEDIGLLFQPIVDAGTSRIVAVEALARWRRDDGTSIEPAEFIAFAEQTGLILPLGQQTLDLACRQNKAWQTAGLPPVRVTVNLSARQLQRRPGNKQAAADPVKLVEEALAQSGLAPEWLELEVTESVFLTEPDYALAALTHLQGMGVRITIDDFGTGYSSFKYLKVLPVQTLKIDREFVRLVGRDERDTALTAAMIAMGHSLGMEVVAEGVETVEQWKSLRQLGVDAMQGYLFTKPLSANEMTALMADRARSAA